MTRMLLCLYIIPGLLIALALMLNFYGASYLEATSQAGPLAALADQAVKYTFLFAKWSLGASALWTIYATIRFYRWHQGKEAVCPKCGGMVTEKVGRYGPYVKCFACGRNSKRAQE